MLLPMQNFILSAYAGRGPYATSTHFFSFMFDDVLDMGHVQSIGLYFTLGHTDKCDA